MSPGRSQVLAFDVNETLLDLGALDERFEAAFGDAGLRPAWFQMMLQLAFVGGLTGRYVDFTTAQHAALAMLAERAGRTLGPDGGTAIPSRLEVGRQVGPAVTECTLTQRHDALRVVAAPPEHGVRWGGIDAACGRRRGSPVRRPYGCRSSPDWMRPRALASS